MFFFIFFFFSSRRRHTRSLRDWSSDVCSSDLPLLVDSFIVVATGADLWFTTTKQKRRLWEIWWPKALLAGAAGVSFILNVAHAESGNWAARGVAAIPPAALILGVELLMMVLRRATTIRSA